MQFRSAITALASAGAMAASLGLAPVAQADPPAPVTCTITTITPTTITVGLAPRTIQFTVQTSCDGTYPVSWDLSSDRSSNTPTPSWLWLRNYPAPADVTYMQPITNADGDLSVSFDNPNNYHDNYGNKMAGPHPLSASAFYDVDGNHRAGANEPVTHLGGTVIVKRATAFTDFYASTDQIRAGRRIYFSGVLQRANWDTNAEDGFAAPVELQFRADGHRHFHDVKAVHNDGTDATTGVRATQSGTYRYRYLGDDVSGAAYSSGVHVSVHRHHHRHH